MLIPFLSRYDQTEDERWLTRFREFLPEHQVLRHAELSETQRASARVAIVAGPPSEMVLAYPKLEWVSSTWAGVETVLQAVPPSVGIARLVDPELSAKMGEAVLTAVLALHRNLPEYAAQQAQHLWRKLPYTKPADRTVALLGLGELGLASIEALRPRGFKLIGWSRTQKAIEGVDCFAGYDGLQRVLAKADTVVCLLPLTSETTGLINAERLRNLPQGASIINFARGPIIDEQALLTALNDGHLRHAVLDVFDHEPLPSDHPFWGHPKVTVLPHISALTDSRSAAQIVTAKISSWLADGTLPEFVDRSLEY